MTAMKTASKNGTSKGAAYFIPAITTTIAALTMIARDAGENELSKVTPYVCS